MVVYSFTILKSKYKKIHKGEILQAAVNKSDLRITQIVKKHFIDKTGVSNLLIVLDRLSKMAVAI